MLEFTLSAYAIITIFTFPRNLFFIGNKSSSFQVGKGRDVGLNQIALFEGKVAGGNGEQVLSRDVYRLGQLFDFFRMLTFFFTTVGFYVCTMVLPSSLAACAHWVSLWFLIFSVASYVFIGLFHGIFCNQTMRIFECPNS
jgi:hypothetical protein